MQERMNRIKQIRSDYRVLHNLLEKDGVYMQKDEKDELKSSINKLLAIIAREEESFFDIEKGMYVGMGINLLSIEDNEVVPCYWDWDKITNHWGVQGASGVGKTILMLTHARQIIEKGWNLVITDPKGGHGQEIVNAVASFAKHCGREDDVLYMSPAYPDMHFFFNPLFGMSDSAIASLESSLLKEAGQDPFYGDVTFKTIHTVCSGLTLLQFMEDPDGSITQEEELIELGIFETYFKTRSFDMVFDSSNNLGTPDNVEVLSRRSDGFRSEKEGVGTAVNRSMITFKTLRHYSNRDNILALKKVIERAFGDLNEKADHYEKAAHMYRDAMAGFEFIENQDPVFFTKVTESMAVVNLKLSTGEIGELFCRFKVNPLIPKLINKDKGVIMILQPFPMQFGDVSDMFIKIIFRQLEIFLGNIGSTEMELDKRLVVMIDEAGSVAYPGIESLFNKARSLGLTLGVYTQSFQDWIASLEDTKARITMDNINTTVRMRMNDDESCERVAKEVGTIKEMRSTTIASGEASTKAIIGAETTDIVDPTNVALMPIGRGIVKYGSTIRLVDFPHYGKTYSRIVFDENKYFDTMNRLAKGGVVNMEPVPEEEVEVNVKIKEPQE